MFSNPSVDLQDGLIITHGTVSTGPLRANIRIETVPSIDENGDLELSVTAADFGPLPLPAAVRDGISTLITEAFVGSIATYATGIRLTTIAITDGEMALRGELR